VGGLLLVRIRLAAGHGCSGAGVVRKALLVVHC
jgi:hypothetical protein